MSGRHLGIRGRYKRQIWRAETRTQDTSWNSSRGLPFLIMDGQALTSFPFSRGLLVKNNQVGLHVQATQDSSYLRAPCPWEQKIRLNAVPGGTKDDYNIKSLGTQKQAREE